MQRNHIPGESLEADSSQLMMISNYLFAMGKDGAEDLSVYRVADFPEFFKKLSSEIAGIAARIRLAGICLEAEAKS